MVCLRSIADMNIVMVFHISCFVSYVIVNSSAKPYIYIAIAFKMKNIGNMGTKGVNKKIMPQSCFMHNVKCVGHKFLSLELANF